MTRCLSRHYPSISTIYTFMLEHRQVAHDFPDQEKLS